MSHTHHQWTCILWRTLARCELISPPTSPVLAPVAYLVCLGSPYSWLAIDPDGSLLYPLPRSESAQGDIKLCLEILLEILTDAFVWAVVRIWSGALTQLRILTETLLQRPLQVIYVRLRRSHIVLSSSAQELTFYIRPRRRAPHTRCNERNRIIRKPCCTVYSIQVANSCSVKCDNFCTVEGKPQVLCFYVHVMETFGRHIVGQFIETT